MNPFGWGVRSRDASRGNEEKQLSHSSGKKRREQEATVITKETVKVFLECYVKEVKVKIWCEGMKNGNQIMRGIKKLCFK